ncbi:hypothetical protein DAPPUDRAFT_338650, partial [Daphnia pulex]
MVALVIEEHPVPAVEKNILVSERGFKVLFFLLSFCNSIMALFIFFSRPLSRDMEYVVDLPFEKFAVLNPIELSCGYQLILLAVVFYVLYAVNIEIKRKMAPVIALVQISVALHALFLIAFCKYSISSLQTKLDVHCRESTNSDELLGLGMCSKDYISNQFTFYAVMIVFGR